MRCALLIAAGLLAASPATSVASQRFIVVIGNNQGQRDETTLRYAERDANQVAEVFERVGGVPPQNTVRAFGSDAEGVRAVLAQVSDRISKASASDEDTALIVYYSGHADAQGLHLGDSPLAYQELESIVRSIPARVRVLILDGCRSGGLTRVKGGRPVEPFAIKIDNRLNVEGVALITSSAAGEDSHESDRLRGSFFTHHLLSGLMGAADLDTNSKLTLAEVYNYAYEHTLRSSQRTLSLQHPTHAFDIKGRGEFVLTDLGSDKRRSGALRLHEPGLYLVMATDADGPIVAEVAVREPNTKVALPAGTYFVQQRGPSEYREYRVSLDAGQQRNLDEIEHRTVAYARLVRKGGPEKNASQGLFVAVGASGAVIDGVGISRDLLATYALDLPWATFSARFRWGDRGRSQTGPQLQLTHDELAGAIAAQRFFDLPVVSAGVGLIVEGVHHRQRFETSGNAPARTAWGLTLGALVTIEVDLVWGATLRVEGGPMTHVYRQVETQAGAAAGDVTTSRFTWAASGGLGWRF